MNIFLFDSYVSLHLRGFLSRLAKVCPVVAVKSARNTLLDMNLPILKAITGLFIAANNRQSRSYPYSRNGQEASDGAVVFDRTGSG